MKVSMRIMKCWIEDAPARIKMLATKDPDCMRFRIPGCLGKSCWIKNIFPRIISPMLKNWTMKFADYSVFKAIWLFKNKRVTNLA